MARTHLVIGCGYVGREIAKHLHAQGETVIGVTHSPESAAKISKAEGFPVHACDISNPEAVANLSALVSPTLNPELRTPLTVVHCASSSRGGPDAYRAVYLEGTRNLLSAFPGAHFLFTSSTSVYPQTQNEIVTEESDATPDRETSQILRETEDLILAHGGAVARLAGIYGPGRSFVLKSFLEGTATIEGNEGYGRYLNQIHRHDAATALAHLALQQTPGIFNVVDDRPMTQRECFEELLRRFHRHLPPLSEPNPGRKRAWTSKQVSNARLRATGWSPRYPSYFDALDRDPDLVPSILAQLPQPGMNIVIIGLMGSGKSTVGKMVAHSLGFTFVDTDHLITEAAGRSIPEIFATEGEAAFRERETAVLRSLAGHQRLVIATGGGIVTQSQNIPLLKKLGAVVWLDADPANLYKRIAHNHERPLLHTPNPAATLQQIHAERRPLYEAACDWKIATDDLSSQDVAYGLAESARVHFAGRAG
jgi:shikimate kinase/nucleoside-diphosphate-sugar epimerase